MRPLSLPCHFASSFQDPLLRLCLVSRGRLGDFEVLGESVFGHLRVHLLRMVTSFLYVYSILITFVITFVKVSETSCEDW